MARPLLPSTMLNVGVMLVTPVMVDASALNALVAAVCAAASGCVIMGDVTAASAPASAAALSWTRFCAALVKSSAIPVKNTHGMRDNAKMIATLPLRFRENRRIKVRSM